MGRRRKGRGNRDGISILDQWEAKGRKEGRRWRYRVWDNEVGKYASACFADDPTEDTQRARPGCAAGDRWAAAKKARIGLSIDSAASVTLQDIGAAYVASRETLGRSVGHVQAIRLTLTKAGEAGVRDLSAKDVPTRVQRWLSRLEACRPGQRKTTPASARVKNHHINILRSLGAFAVRRGHLAKNPFLAVERFAESKRQRKVYTIAELRRLVADEHNAHPWWPFIVLAAYTGLRSETLRAITWAMVDWDANRLRVPAHLTKTNADLRVPIQPELRTILAAAPGVGSRPILPPLAATATSDRANELTQRYLETVGIDPAGRSVHAFRHSYASLLTATGLSTFLVMDAVGHSSTQTSKHYARGSDEYRDQVVAEGWPEGELFLRRDPQQRIRPAANA